MTESTTVAVVEPQPRLAVRVSAMVATLGLDVWDGEGIPDVAVVAVDSIDEEWADEVARWIDEEEGPIVLLTGVSARRLAEQGHARIRQRLVRPFDLEALGLALQSALSGDLGDATGPVGVEAVATLPEEGDIEVEADDIEIVVEHADDSELQQATERIRVLAMTIAEQVPAWAALDRETRYREIAVLLGINP